MIHVPILNTTFLQPKINFSDYDAIVLTSKQAVRALNKISSAWKKIPALSIASKTEEMVQNSGAVLLDRGEGYGDTLDDIIVKKYHDLRWLYPRPKVVASNFMERVKEQGIKIEDAVVYETSCNSTCQTLELPDNAILIFTSPFTITCFLEYFEFLPTYRVVVIGKTTAKSLPKNLVSEMPDTPNVDSCVRLAKEIQEREISF